MRRIVLTGSESTGKTTLARALAARLSATYVPEFVREYVEETGRAPEFADHGPIARGQAALEDAAIARESAIIVQDTDLLSTAVYCEHYFGSCPPWIAEMARARRPDLYLLMDIDIPWVPDPARDRGDRREEMHALFHSAVAASGAPWTLIRGAGEDRLTAAIGALSAAFPDLADALRRSSPG